MYCKRCGNFVKEDDTKCRACGTIIEKSEKEPVAQDKLKKETHPQQPPEANSEFKWDIHDFPKSKKTEDAVFVWDSSALEAEETEAEEIPLEEQLFKEISKDSENSYSEDLDKFLTFSRKNEEFQKLLDQEYERLQQHPDAEPQFMEEEESTEEPPVQQEPVADKEELLEEPEAVEEAKELMKPEESIEAEEPVEQETPEAIEDPEAEKTPEAIEEPEAAKTPGHKKETLPGDGTQIEEMQAARASFFSEEIIQDNETIKKKYGPPEDAGEPATEKEHTESGESTQQEPIEDIAAAPQKSVEDTLPEEPAGAIEPTEPAGPAAKEAKKGRLGRVLLTIIAIILVFEIILLGIRYFAPESDASRIIGEGQRRVAVVISDWVESIGNLFSGGDGEDLEDEEDQETLMSTEGQTDDEEEEKPAPNPEPEADKEKLIASRQANNKNIETISANDSLAHVQGKNYGLADINKSQPLTDNIWFIEEDGEAVYYDASIIGTLISFDSCWIDYVNGEDSGSSVFDFVKKDSKAYENTAGFSKIGKIKETFKSLEIGEIRQGEKGFYVWVREEIQIEEGGKATVKAYNWIYHLEPENGKMKIINYYKF